MSALVRPFEVVIWGATGFTGKLVCEHIANDYQGKLRWAIAGRDRAKLEAVRSDLAKKNPSCKDVPIFLADGRDPASLDKFMGQTSVVISTAGPYAQVGTPVVEASLRNGTHYCDITAEVPWIRNIAGEFHEQAQEKKVKIVHACGFDSIPSDLVTLVAVDYAKSKLDRAVDSVEMVWGKISGGISGGTIASGFNMFAEPLETRKAANDPYSLDPPESRRGPDGPDQVGIGFCKALNVWTVPFLMAFPNSRIVRRSNALRGIEGQSYGESFGYKEVLGLPRLWQAVIAETVMLFVGLIVKFSPLQKLVRGLLPKQGTGPSRDQLMNGFWNGTIVATTEKEGNNPPQTVFVDVKGKRDPGYWETPRLLLESALCLARDAAKLEAAGLPVGGVLTPASALGLVLVDRLRAAGVEFNVRPTQA